MLEKETWVVHLPVHNRLQLTASRPVFMFSHSWERTIDLSGHPHKWVVGAEASKSASSQDESLVLHQIIYLSVHIITSSSVISNCSICVSVCNQTWKFSGKSFLNTFLLFSVHTELFKYLTDPCCVCPTGDWKYTVCLLLFFRVRPLPPVQWWETCHPMMACQEDPCPRASFK